MSILKPGFYQILGNVLKWPAWVRYLLAFVIMAQFSELRMKLDPVLGTGFEFTTFYLGVVLITYWFGTGPALFAVVLGGVTGNFRFMAPRGHYKFDLTVVIAEFFYLAVCLAFVSTVHALRKAHLQTAAEAAESHRRALAAEAAESALRESRERFRAAIAASRTGTFRWDFSTGLLDCDASLSRLLGLVSGESIQSMTSFSDRVHPDDRITFLKESAARAADGSDFEMEFQAVWPDGSVHWLEGKARTFSDAKGSPLYMIGACTDITSRKLGNAELEAARDEALKASRAKSTFLTNMSHELRTPLNAIIGYSEMLHEQAEENGVGSMSLDLSRINSAGKHLLNLINDVLDLSRVEAGKMRLSICRFDVCSILDEAAAMVKPLREKHRNTIDVICHPNVGIMESDETKVRQIIYNLINNAVKFTENGRITVEASRETLDAGEWIVFRVSDTGIGMEPEQVSSLFQEFYQGDTSSTRKHGGSGLGLAISKRFTQMMGGELKVVSQPKLGSTFTVRLLAELKAEDASKTADAEQAE